MRSTSQYRRNPDFVHRRVGDEEILVPVRRNGADLSSIFLLNEVGAAIWRHLAEPRTSDQLLREILREFDIDSETAAADLASFLEELHSAEAVTESLS